MRDLSTKIKQLAVLAVAEGTPTNEAHTAALQVCRIILDPANTVSAHGRGNGKAEVPSNVAPPKPSGRSEIHPVAAAFREWERFKREHEIRELQNNERDFCVACGKELGEGEPILYASGVGSTHNACDSWWWNCEFPYGDGDTPY